MARLLGPIPVDKWEREVLNQLKLQLPHDWLVISNVTWAFRGENGFVNDGQSDFVVLVPNSGMVIVEVKGSKEIWIDDDGKWYRSEPNGGRALIVTPPPEQAMGNMHQLAKIVEQKGGWIKFPGRYSWLVVYPNGIANQVPALFDSSTLITSRQMNGLTSSIRNSLEQRGFEGRGRIFDLGVVEKVAQILTSRPFSITKADSQFDVRDDVSHIESLTRQQFAALKGIFELPKVAVTGPAGSGKTLLAIWRLQAVIEAGKRALFVCFNTKLAEMLRWRHPEYASSIVSVDKFFVGMCPGIRCGTEVSTFFREILPAAALDVAAGYSEAAKYDTIIVDEGQDFSEFQLYALNELLRRENSEWIIFADRRQDLFQMHSEETFGAEVVFRLHHNCRNTQRVNDATNFYLGKQRVDSMPGMPVGEHPTIQHCSNKDVMAIKAWELAKQWNTDRGVVILSPYTLDKSSMANSRKGHGLELSENLADIDKNGMACFSTIRSFKGIEAPAIILIDADIPSEEEHSAFRFEDLYVACTRPTARIAILSKSQEACQWFNERLSK